MSTKQVEAAIDVLAEAHARHEKEAFRDKLKGMLNGAAKESPYSVQRFFNEDTEDHSSDALRYAVGVSGGGPMASKRTYKRSAAGRARQIAAMKKYWKAKRAAARKAGKK